MRSARSHHPLAASRRSWPVALAGLAAAFMTWLALVAPAAAADARVADLTVHEGNVPRRFVGYGLVVGLDGTGDRSFGTATSSNPTVQSVVNLLNRFSIEVPPDRLRLRNVAAVLVTAEASPYLRAGGRFDVQVSALGDATSLKGGVLWITPLVLDPNEPPIATAQGSLFIAADDPGRASLGRRANSARVPSGGVLEIELEHPPTGMRLALRDPDLGTAQRIVQSVNTVFGAGTARAEDAGAVTLVPDSLHRGDAVGFLAAVDTVMVATRDVARIVIDGRDGTVVAGGAVRVGAAAISHNGITLQIGGVPTPGAPRGLVRVEQDASVQDVAAGLHAAGAGPQEIAAIFESLKAAGALAAEVLVR